MKSVLISIQPKWVEKIVKGEKTIEVRKTAPKETPFKGYIYCTKGRDLLREISCWNTKTEIHTTNYKIINLDYCTNKIANGKVIGEFICDKIDEYKFHEGLTEFNSMGLPSRTYGSYLIFTDDYKAMCLSYDEVKNYGKGKTLYGWHIYDLKIYNEPKELSEFKTGCKGCKERDTYHCKFYCYGERPLTRPPQSYMYVEELE